MRKTSKQKHVRSLAWLMAACLTMTTVVPVFTAFAGEEYENVAVTDDSNELSEKEYTKEETEVSKEAEDDINESEVSGDPEDNTDKTEDPSEEGAEQDSNVSNDAPEDDEEGANVSDFTEEDEEGTDAVKEDDADDPSNVPLDKLPEHDVVKNEVLSSKEKEEEEDEEEDAIDGLLDVEEASLRDVQKAVCEYNGGSYETIQEAVDAVEGDKGVITLTQNVEEKQVTITGKEVDLDLGGYTLTGKLWVNQGSKVTVDNGIIDSGSSYIVVCASGNDDDPTEFTLKADAAIKSVDYGMLICGVTGSKDTNGTGYVVTIDGTVEVSDHEGSGIWIQGNMKTTSAKVCDLYVNGTVTSGMDDGPSIAINGWGNVYIGENAVIIGATGIEIRAGSLTVNGGTIIGGSEVFSDNSNTHGSTSVGAGIMINEHVTALPITVTINDGDISGYYALIQDNTEEKENEINMEITGGTFMGYDEDCAILINEYAGNEEKFSILGGTFVNSQGEISNISAYLPPEYQQDENGMIAPEKPIVDEDGDTGSGTGGGHTVSHSGSSSSDSSSDVSTDEYVGANGVKGNWFLTGQRFIKEDGTHPSNEYLMIDGTVYAFNISGYPIPFYQIGYYTEEAIVAAGDIPEAVGTWELCGWKFQYADGLYPRNDWAQIIHNGQSDWYYFDPEGWMLTGWLNIDGYWYYLGEDGAMLHNTYTPDGHFVDESGRMVR